MKKIIILVSVIAVLLSINFAIAKQNTNSIPPGLSSAPGIEKKLADLCQGSEGGQVFAIFTELIEIIKEQDSWLEANGEYKDKQYYEKDGVSYAVTNYAKSSGVGYTVFITTSAGTIYLNFGPDAEQSQVPYL